MLTKHITLRITEDQYEWLTDHPEGMGELIRRLIDEEMTHETVSSDH